MFMREPSSDQELETHLVLSPTATVILAVAGVVFLGVYPGPLVFVVTSSAIPLPWHSLSLMLVGFLGAFMVHG